MLILAVDHVPIGLTRFLVAKWITKPSSLWLEDQRSFRSYLKEVPNGIINTATARTLRLQKLNCSSDDDFSLSLSDTDQEFPDGSDYRFDYSYE
jgi:hypothetical protein